MGKAMQKASFTEDEGEIVSLGRISKCTATAGDRGCRAGADPR